MNRELIQQFDRLKRNERHRNNAETAYWCNQYKLFARHLLSELLAKPANDFHPDWDTLKPYHDRIAELEAQLAKPEYPDLRKAAEMALEALETRCTLQDRGMAVPKVGNAIEALRQALAQPEQEPVAWQVMVENEPMKEFSIKDVAHDWAVTEKLNGSKYSYWIRPLYTAPQKPDVTLTNEGKTWQGLTDDEIQQAAYDLGTIGDLSHDEFDIAHAVIAKLREKNG